MCIKGALRVTVKAAATSGHSDWLFWISYAVAWVRKVTVVPGLRPPELPKIFARADDVAGITG